MQDILQLFNIQNSTGNLVEGFIVIRPQNQCSWVGIFSVNLGATVFSRPLSQDLLDLLNVSSVYSANALLTLPHAITNG